MKGLCKDLFLSTCSSYFSKLTVAIIKLTIKNVIINISDELKYLTRPIELTGHENPRERQFAQTPNKGLIKLGANRIKGGFHITVY